MSEKEATADAIQASIQASAKEFATASAVANYRLQSEPDDIDQSQERSEIELHASEHVP